MVGVVRFYSIQKKFGFISYQLSDGLPIEDVFFHVNDVVGREHLGVGERVEFALTRFNGRTCATTVRRVTGDGGAR